MAKHVGAQTQAPLADDLVIRVEASGDVWVVRSKWIDRELSFPSAWQAELAAKRIGRELVGAGYIGEIEVYLRGGELAGRLACGS